jgi:hypothetical protein
MAPQRFPAIVSTVVKPSISAGRRIALRPGCIGGKARQLLTSSVNATSIGVANLHHNQLAAQAQWNTAAT